jgi:hypothetical protein
MEHQILLKLVILIRRELRSNRESLLHGELENFIGCLLAEARDNQLLTTLEEREIRRRIFDD